MKQTSPYVNPNVPSDQTCHFKHSVNVSAVCWMVNSAAARGSRQLVNPEASVKTARKGWSMCTLGAVQMDLQAASSSQNAAARRLGDPGNRHNCQALITSPLEIITARRSCKSMGLLHPALGWVPYLQCLQLFAHPLFRECGLI